MINDETVRHSAGQYVEGEAHWSLVKRGIYGTYHHISPKHTHRYAVEFAGRHNDRSEDTLDQMQGVEVSEPTPEERHAAAVALGRLGGKKGGPARAKKLTAEQRSESARKAARVRWRTAP